MRLATAAETAWEPYVEDPSKLLHGATPGKDDKEGLAVRARMASEGKLVGDKGRYGRDSNRIPLPAGHYTWHRMADCDMGHIVDAVVWWNSNGRFTGPQSPEVRRSWRTRTTTNWNQADRIGFAAAGSAVRYKLSAK